MMHYLLRKDQEIDNKISDTKSNLSDTVCVRDFFFWSDLSSSATIHRDISWSIKFSILINWPYASHLRWEHVE